MKWTRWTGELRPVARGSGIPFRWRLVLASQAVVVLAVLLARGLAARVGEAMRMAEEIGEARAGAESVSAAAAQITSTSQDLAGGTAERSAYLLGDLVPSIHDTAGRVHEVAAASRRQAGGRDGVTAGAEARREAREGCAPGRAETRRQFGGARRSYAR